MHFWRFPVSICFPILFDEDDLYVCIQYCGKIIKTPELVLPSFVVYSPADYEL